METIKINVNNEGLIKNIGMMFSDRFKVLSELIQNARRAGSSLIEFSQVESDIHIRDHGCGVDNLSDLLEIAKSGWDERMESETPYGMGFLSTLLSCEAITVHSKNKTFTANCASILDGHSVVVDPAPEIEGFELTLHDVKQDILKSLRTELFKVSQAQEIRVFLNGDELPRPYCSQALLESGRKAVDFELGTIYLKPGCLRRDYTGILQGCLLRDIQALDVGGHFVIFNDKVKARLPDRDSLIDHDLVKDQTSNAIRNTLIRVFNELRLMLGDRLMITHHWKSILELDATLLNDLEWCSKSAVRFLDSVVTRGFDGFSTQYEDIKRSDMKNKRRFDSSAFDNCRYDPGSFALPTYISQIDGVVEVDAHIDRKHWLFELEPLPEVTNADIQVTLVNAKEAFHYESEWLYKTPVILCDSIVMDGPLGRRETNSIGFFDGTSFIIPSGCNNGMAIGQCLDFDDEWGVEDTSRRDMEESLFYDAIARNRIDCPQKRLALLLSDKLPTLEREPFAGQSFVLRFAEDGSPVVEAA